MENVTRSRGPHSFHPDRLKEHNQRCIQAPPGMILSSMAYNRRCRKTTFGVSNRIEFLRQLKQEGASPAPPYPPMYHGPSGEGGQFALGLSIAGTAGNDRILGPVCNFGRLDGKVLLKRPQNMSSNLSYVHSKNNSMISSTNNSIKNDQAREANSDLGFKFILMSEKTNTIKKNSEHVKKEGVFKIKPGFQETKATILPHPDSHFNCSEVDRYSRVFIDEQGVKAKNMYQEKLANYVQDKNSPCSQIFSL